MELQGQHLEDILQEEGQEVEEVILHPEEEEQAEAEQAQVMVLVT
jgi:hypothetical protein